MQAETNFLERVIPTHSLHDKILHDAEFDYVIVGAGVSGSWWAYELTRRGARCLVLEAGRYFRPAQYPVQEIDGNSQLYWAGGIEFDDHANLGLLRPKVVGGGSIVNQALVDRFDDLALDSWRERSKLDSLSVNDLEPWYERVESLIRIEKIPVEAQNGNAKIFAGGLTAQGFGFSPLRRAQSGCDYAKNDCIECLNGCRVGSKQSTPWTILWKAHLSGNLVLVPEAQVRNISESASNVRITAISSTGQSVEVFSKRAVLASGAIGNSLLLLRSGFGEKLPHLGQGFYTHPQYMTLGVYDREIHAEKGPLQTYKSDEPRFRKNGFKLENVFAPPVAISMLVPGFGKKHAAVMEQVTKMACVEVAIRDTQAGSIRIKSDGRAAIEKHLNKEDLSRKQRGQQVVRKIFRDTGAKKVIEGSFGIGLHLMGGCALGSDPKSSVVGPEFQVHSTRRIFAADSSIFPDAPGINPSLTIMALSLKAASEAPL